MSNVLDLSHWNAITSMADIKAGGILGVILKCTQGTSYVDPTFRDRYVDAIATGLAVSTYHYLDAGKDVTKQMAHYLKTLSPREGERVCIDFEAEGSTLSDLKNAVQYILVTRPDLQITVYSGHLIKDVLGGKRDALLAENTSLWIAHYTSAQSPTWPTATWPQWSLWQFTDKGAAKGVKGNVDTNRFNGSDENLVKWIGPADSAPAPSPEPEPEPAPEKLVSVVIAAPDDVTVSVTINGTVIVN